MVQMGVLLLHNNGMQQQLQQQLQHIAQQVQEDNQQQHTQQLQIQSQPTHSQSHTQQQQQQQPIHSLQSLEREYEQVRQHINKLCVVEKKKDNVWREINENEDRDAITTTRHLYDEGRERDENENNNNIITIKHNKHVNIQQPPQLPQQRPQSPQQQPQPQPPQQQPQQCQQQQVNDNQYHFQWQQHHQETDRIRGRSRDRDRDKELCSMSDLPNELLLHIFSFLGASHLSKGVMRVCTLFTSISLDESLWRPLYYMHWGNHRVSLLLNNSGKINNNRDNSITWRSLFGVQSLTESNWWHGRNTVCTLQGHKGAVRCVQFSGETMVTGSSDKTIKVWDLSNERCTQTLHDNKWIRCLRFDSPSSTLVTTGMDSTQAKVWNLTTSTVSHVLDVHRGCISCLQLNMPKLVTGSLDGTIRVWDASTGHKLPSGVVLSGHDSLRGLWLSGDLVMSAGLERNLQLWDLRVKPNTKPSATVEGAAHGHYCVQFDMYTYSVVSGSRGTVALADLRIPNISPTSLKGHTDVISCLQFSGRKLVTGSMDQTIRIWDMSTHQCANTLLGHESWVWDLQIDPDKIVTASGDKTVKLWAFNHSL